MFQFLTSLFGARRDAVTNYPACDQEAAFVEAGTLSLRSGALTIDSGAGSSPSIVFLEPGRWTVFQSKDQVVTSVALVRPQLAEARELEARKESAVVVDDGCVFFADSEVLERDEVKSLLELEERVEPARWPKGFFLSSTGIGDGVFPITLLSTREHAFDRLGLMAVVVSFTVTPTERVLRALAARLPPWKAKRSAPVEAARNGFSRNSLGVWHLVLAERSELLQALRARQPWTLGDLQLSHGETVSLTRERFIVKVTLNAELGDRVCEAVQSAAPGASLEFAELPDLVIHLP